MRKTLTYDRGTEMACHEEFTARSGVRADRTLTHPAD
jgi:IS30 family transposase